MPDEGLQAIALTRSRRDTLRELVDDWLSRRPSVGASLDGQLARAEPRELASLLGRLVFCCEVVPGGRTYMQSMLRQFAGLEVDWARGAVRHVHGAWGLVDLRSGFWRDLVWWRGALDHANYRPMHEPRVGVAAVVGTDASDHGCGELAWIDGSR